eukprot:15436369-Alexandrium_andersonii.AAC.1
MPGELKRCWHWSNRQTGTVSGMRRRGDLSTGNGPTPDTARHWHWGNRLAGAPRDRAANAGEPAKQWQSMRGQAAPRPHLTPCRQSLRDTLDIDAPGKSQAERAKAAPLPGGAHPRVHREWAQRKAHRCGPRAGRATAAPSEEMASLGSPSGTAPAVRPGPARGPKRRAQDRPSQKRRPQARKRRSARHPGQPLRS